MPVIRKYHLCMRGIVINLARREDRWIAFQKQDFPFPVERFEAYDMPRGEDGCTMSHLKVIDSIETFPTIVFEDDVVMLQPWSFVDDILRQQMPVTWDALWLGANINRPLKRRSRNLYYLNNAFCLHAVIYNSRKMIDFILKNHNTPPGKNLDIFYNRQVFDKFDCYITYPMAATQASGYSDICKRSVEYGIEELIPKFNGIIEGQIQRRKLRRHGRSIL